jgi:integrase
VACAGAHRVTCFELRDPTADLRGALAPVEVEHFAAVTKPKELGALLRALDGFEGTLVVKCALRLAPLVFVRPGELRKAEWSEIDRAEWNIAAEKTKLRRPHLVPMSTQAVAILRTSTAHWPRALRLSRPRSHETHE